MTLEKKRERKQLQQEQQSSRISGTVTFIATKRNFIFCIFFFLVLLLIFYFLKIPATGEEPFSSENRTQNGRVLFLPQLYALDRFWIFMLRQIEHFFFLSNPYHFKTMVIINGKQSIYLNVSQLIVSLPFYRSMFPPWRVRCQNCHLANFIPN